ncbi:MAG TPA: hypothetical protein VFO02_03170, partial [Burkholderiales bacterium]|nr:hypothetical protein [Burkholderiales bacterium]
TLPDGEVLVEPLTEPLVVPPDAESFFAGSVVEEDELEDDGELGVVVPDAEPDGELGVVAEPEDEVAPEPGVARRSPVLSPQAVSILAPSTMEIANAKAESLI